MNSILNKLSLKDEEELYIPETESFIVLKNYILETMPKTTQKAMINMALDLLKQVLFRMYKATDYNLLVKRVSQYIDECQTFSKHMSEAIKDSGWAVSTARNVYCALKRALSLTAISPEFVHKIKFVQSQLVTKEDRYIPSQKVKEDSLKRELFQKWADILRDTTNNRSSASIQAILRFYNGILPKLELKIDSIKDLENIDKEYLAIKFDDKEYIRFLNLSQPQLRWLKILIVNILDIQIKPDVFTQIIKKKQNIIEDDGSDKHRLSPTELQALYEQVRDDIRDELIYMLFVTTGMRIGGLVKIRLEHVAEINGAAVIAKPSGRTLEKGSKWFTFVINNRVNELLTQWIKNLRPNNGSPYLFPGRCDVPYLKEASVRKRFHTWCKKAGLSGTHLHPHSLRHSYGHLLLEAGNSVHEVSKLLGHSNIATTEMFYLKESSADVAKRANIPWLTKPEKQDNLPKFLIPSSSTQTNSAGAQLKEKQDRERKRRMKNMAKIGGFVVKASLDSVQE
jgi:integrase